MVRSEVSNPQLNSPGSVVLGAQTAPLVAILLCTKNGSRFLSEQLKSIASQTHKNWQIFASDDGSTDATLSSLSEFADQHVERVFLRSGPRQGFTKNFLSLAADSTIDAEYFAYCDQDDVWHDEKLTRAVTWLQTIPQETPALYGARVAIIDELGRDRGRSKLFRRMPCFENALVQSIAGGNTMVFNRSAKRLIERAGILDVVAHDWWTYIVISAAGGAVHYDPDVSVMYRQHAGNLIGSNAGLNANLQRLKMLLANGYRKWNATNIAALDSCIDLIEPRHRITVSMFKRARSHSTVQRRLCFLYKSGVFRQTLLGDLGLIVSAALRKL
jgi:glycosyltransferase involved in cell wall biosynthesis